MSHEAAPIDSLNATLAIFELGPKESPLINEKRDTGIEVPEDKSLHNNVCNLVFEIYGHSSTDRLP